MKLCLVDTNATVAEELRATFSAFPEVTVSYGNILDIAECAVVSPANSYGFMDGGIDLAYSTFFGPRPETELRTAIAQRPSGHLEVGSAILVQTGHIRIPYLISAPTMVFPSRIPAHNCFYAMAAVLNAATRHSAVISSLFCPGLGTGVGEVEPSDAAREMASAYGKWRVRESAT